MRIIIIGGEAAGMSAAAKAKRRNREASVVVYEMSDIVSFGACGLPYYVGDFFQEEERMIARTTDKFRESGIEIELFHEVTKIDLKNKQITVKNRRTKEEFKDQYDRLLIATGASAIKPPIDGMDLRNVFTLKTMEDGRVLKEAALKEMNQHVVIMGAGYIGLEVVEAMKKLGKEVTVIQLTDHILTGSFDEEMAEIIEKGLTSHQIHLSLNEEVIALEGEEDVKKVVTKKGEYKADIVVVATGIRPNTQFLKDTGIEMLKNGAIVINEYGETSIKDIYAAGDCASVYHLVRKENVYIALATTANKIGRIIGENLVGHQMRFEGTLGSACLKVMDYEAGRTGISEAEAKEMNISYKTTVISDKNQTDYYPGQEDIHAKLIYESETKRILGAQLVGKKGAALRIDALAVAIYSALTTDQLGMMDFCYAPPFSRTWDVMNVVGNVSK
ncbi:MULTISPECIES: CoA-disulfide reductase [Bacillus]|uniref:CoA-disulfide reductase n=1 Tax=Bacillus TaxID=1386 RepID=UPI00031BCA15|nr:MULTISPECIES: CoA-disulfide reductase [Bacillus]